MTARKKPNPDGLNAKGDGRGLKKVTRPVSKKRGANATEEAKAQRIAENRAKHRNLTNIPVAQIAETVDPNKPLTDKAKAFVKFWAQGESIQTAAIKAGYGDGASYAYRLVHTPQAIALYNEEKRKYEEAAQMTRKQVIDGILEGIEMAKLLAEPANVIGGWREIGKLCGYYEPKSPKKVELTVNGQVAVHKLNQLSDADLLKVIEQQAPLLIQEALNEVDDEDRDVEDGA